MARDLASTPPSPPQLPSGGCWKSEKSLLWGWCHRTILLPTSSRPDEVSDANRLRIKHTSNKNLNNINAISDQSKTAREA